MKLLATLACAVLAFSGLNTFAQEEKAKAAAEPEKSKAAVEKEKSNPATQLKDLVTRVRAKVNAKKTTEAELSDELKQFEDLLAEHKDEKTDDVARILVMKAMLYREVIKDDAKGDELMARLQKDFADTKIAKDMAVQEEGRKINAKLKEGTAFPDFDVKDTEGKPLSIAKYRGKVVLVDFWATWCPPCVAEMPEVVKTYEKHHAAGLEIIGISLDDDKDKLAEFIKEKNMPWRQFFDGKGWSNELAAKYGVQAIPATFLLDGEGKIIGRDLHGDELKEAVAKALSKS